MVSKDTPLAGHSLKESDFKEGRVFFTHGEPGTAYRWDAGYAIGRFLAGLKEGKILGVKCDRCGRVVVPPRLFCEKCFKEMDHWIQLPDTGTVNTFSLCYISWDMKRLKDPEIPAVIDIDGTDRGDGKPVGFLHKLGEVDTETLKKRGVGMRVRAVWKPVEQREGRITDILYFKPIEEE